MNYALSVMNIIQFFFAIVIGLYFWNLLKKQKGSKNTVLKESKKEMQKLEAMKRISLTKPLAEKTRPSSFSDIIGQKEGLNALTAALCGPNPQHVILYGPPGVGKTAAARLILKKAKKNELSPFKSNANFIELDATIARFDERSIADPLIGSVHDPIYQGAGAMGQAGIPQPKPGAVTKAHGGILFIDEIGELHPMQLNKLLKVLEDRKVFLDSAYYSKENKNIPRYIHEIFQKGLPADFRLVGATTRQPQDIPPAIRSRCLEIFFNELSADDIVKIVENAIIKINFSVEKGVISLIKNYAANGREAVNMVQLAGGMAISEKRKKILIEDVEKVLNSGRYNPRLEKKIHSFSQIGVVNGLAVRGANSGMLIEIEAAIIKKESSNGEVLITGVVEEEEMKGRGHVLKRKSTAKESARNALTVLRRMMSLEVENIDIHINFPGGIAIDGPSAGVAMAVALYSAISGRAIDNKIAMTGEVSIRGLVKKVGGVNAKIQAARRAGVKKVLIPEENWQNSYKNINGIDVIPITTLEKAIKIAVNIDKEEKIELVTADTLMTIPTA
ncbi:MAG: ATP-dependent protease LonB [Bacillota bacterium]